MCANGQTHRWPKAAEKTPHWLHYEAENVTVAQSISVQRAKRAEELGGAPHFFHI